MEVSKKTYDVHSKDYSNEEDNVEGDFRYDDVLVDKVIQHFDHLFKVLLLGDSGTGKSSLLCRFRDGDLNGGIVEVTGGIVFEHVVFNVDSKMVKLQIWDSAGQQRFRYLTKMHHKNKDAFVIFYDVTNRLSFDNVSTWLNDVLQKAEKAVILLVANKCDFDESCREVSRSEGERLASYHRIPFIETSVVNGDNVELVFEVIARTLIRQANGDEPYKSIFV